MARDTGTEELITLNVNIADWEQRRDAESIRKLDEVMAQSLMFRRADGTVVDKQTFLQALQNPAPFTDRGSEDVVVTVRGERALATLVVVGTKPDGTVGRYRNVRFFLYREGRWQLVFWFNEELIGAPPGQ